MSENSIPQVASDTHVESDRPSVIDQTAEGQDRRLIWCRWIGAGALGVLLIVYLILILSQNIPAANRLGAVEVALILGTAAVITVLAKPDLLRHIKSFKTSWFEVEVREKLQQQAHEIDNVRFMLSLLIPKPEVDHLENLRKPGSIIYDGAPFTLTQLRRLRDFQLVKMNPGQTIGPLLGKKFELHEIMKLTDRGRYLLQRLDEYNKGKPGDGGQEHNQDSDAATLDQSP